MSFGVVFPGQGAQFVGMGKELAESFPSARAVFDQANEILGFDLAKVCFEGPADELNRTDVAQPAILVHSLAALAVMREKGAGSSRGQGAGCSFTAGLSLGEYTALVFAGALQQGDAIRLVRRRGELMQEASERVPSTMVACLGVDREAAEALCDRARGDDVLCVANLNAPGQVVVSGDVVACDRLEKIAEDEKVCRTKRLAVAGAFHSERMRPAAEGLAATLSEIDIAAPTLPFYSNVTADRVEDPSDIRRLLAEQLCSPVRWQESMERAVAAGVEKLDEIGPGKTLAGLQRKIDRAVKVSSFGDVASVS